MPNCYYYDEQRNHCKCYVNENLNELLAENARLRSELESVGTAAYLYGRSDLKAENAKLRELVKDMWPFVEGAMDEEHCPDSECPFIELCMENQVCMAISGFHCRMRELGVEVDG